MKDTGILIFTACIFITLTVCQITMTATDTVPVTVNDSEEDVSDAYSAAAYAVSELEDELININTATEDLLCQIPGIGEVRASRIIEYRETNGGYKSVDDLLNVSGIGEVTLDKIREYVTV